MAAGGCANNDLSNQLLDQGMGRKILVEWLLDRDVRGTAINMDRPKSTTFPICPMGRLLMPLWKSLPRKWMRSYDNPGLLLLISLTPSCLLIRPRSVSGDTHDINLNLGQHSRTGCSLSGIPVNFLLVASIQIMPTFYSADIQNVTLYYTTNNVVIHSGYPMFGVLFKPDLQFQLAMNVDCSP